MPNLEINCVHNSTNSKFYLLADSDKRLLENIREDMVGGPTIVFARKAVSGEIFIRDPTNLWKSFVGIDDSQLYFFLNVKLCQLAHTQDEARFGIWQIKTALKQNEAF